MRRLSQFSIAAILAAALAACGGADKSPQTSTAQPRVASAAPAAVDESSIEFFETRVGDRVFFSTDRTDLTPEARAVLSRQAQWLQINSDMSIVIEGHADERGTREYNLALGARRANAVKSFLASQGVDAGRIRAVTFGRERPEAVCSSESCWSQNRRAVTVVGG